jgi:F420-dependent oxidoreductase-like protein
VVVEGSWGLSYDKPARHMREYLQVLNPLLDAKTARFEGDLYKVQARLDVPDAKTPVPMCIAALGPVMLKLAGSQSDGTVTWMVGPKTISSHIKPSLEAAAQEVGRPSPRIVAGVPMVLTNKPEEAKDFISKTLTVYGQLPSYRAMLDKEGVDGPADVALVGDEATLEAGMKRMKEAGVTDFNAAIVRSQEGDFERTFEFLASRS